MVRIALIGATGAVGKYLVKTLLDYSWSKDNSILIDRVIIYGRRETTIDDYLTSDQKTPDIEIAFSSLLERKVIDFDNIPSDFGKDCSIFISCIGSVIAEVGREGQYKIDHDYPVNAAKIARANGVQVIAICSSCWASLDSRFAFWKMKGEVEEDIKKFDFPCFIAARPGVIRTPRPTRGFLQNTVISVLQFADSGNRASISPDDIAKGMLSAALNAIKTLMAGKLPANDKTQILWNADLMSQSSELQRAMAGGKY